jgi:3-methyladenine DNA glycosylase AlkD
VLALWRSATHREERYAALALARQRKAQAFQTLEALPLYEEMIVSGAWWDFVDELASHAIGELLERYPREMRRTLREWSRSGDLWKRRAAILAQLGFRDATDTKLLYACIRPSLSSREFFLRKAIGWALRQLARYNNVDLVVLGAPAQGGRAWSQSVASAVTPRVNCSVHVVRVPKR